MQPLIIRTITIAETLSLSPHLFASYLFQSTSLTTKAREGPCSTPIAFHSPENRCTLTFLYQKGIKRRIIIWTVSARQVAWMQYVCQSVISFHRTLAWNGAGSPNTSLLQMILPNHRLKSAYFRVGDDGMLVYNIKDLPIESAFLNAQSVAVLQNISFLKLINMS